MAIIISFWVFSLKNSLPGKAEEKKSNELTQSLNRAKQELPSLMSAFKASIGAFFEKDVEIDNEQSVKQNYLKQEPESIAPVRLPLSK